MQQRFRRRARRTVAVIGLLGAITSAASAVNPTASSAATTATNKVGLVCTTSTAGTPTFDLETKVGYIDLPDGNTTFMYGYGLVGKAFQHPSPALCVTEGDAVTITLHNTFNTTTPGQKAGGRVSIMFPGIEDVTASVNGGAAAAVQPEIVSGAVQSLTTSAVAKPASPNGDTVTYRFTAARPGTYIYESGTDPETQVRMGLFGALVVKPKNVADSTPLLPAARMGYAYDRSDSAYMADEEFLILLSEIDPFQHQAVETDSAFDLTTYKPRYWLINGRGFPDSIADNNATWLPNQPYGALARIHPFKKTGSATAPDYHPYPGLARYINVGTEDYPFHPHGNNGSIIGRDGHPLAGPGGEDLSMEKFSLNIGPSQTWDVLFSWYDAENYSPSNPVGVTIPSQTNQTFGMFYSGSPYLGSTGVLPPGATTLNQCGEFYIIAHNHALYQITSWGVNMTGPITYLRVDPPLPNTCA